ncbi:MAG: amidohydrolase [Gemmatimonadales bacterium]|nr:amidohydrolase [Gemmatimonadales bacterium]
MIDPEVFQRMVAIRRDLHRHPELAWQEGRTADRIGRVLDELDIPFRSGVARTGIVADLPGPAGVPAVALRADIDALPIAEDTGLEFSSVHDGVMHACGHDGHTSMVLGAAELLAREPELPAPVRCIFQPAEEKGAGAKAMMDQGVLDEVGMIFGGHLDRVYEVGEIVVQDGPMNASTDLFAIDIAGPGGHGARPHETVDPIVVGSFMIVALQTAVAREVDPTQPAVVSVGRIDAGTAPNVIAGHARLEGTLRAQHSEVRSQLQEVLRRIAEATASAHGADVTVEVEEGTPPVLNSPELVGLARQAAAGVVGAEGIRRLKSGNMGGEDFGFYLQHVPGCYVRFGARPRGRRSFPAHSSRFDFDEEALAVGASYFHQVALIGGRSLADGRTG